MSQFTICILFRTPSLQFFDGNLYSSFRNSDKELCYFLFYFFIYNFNEFTAKSPKQNFWYHISIKSKTIYCFSSAHFKNSFKFFFYYLHSMFHNWYHKLLTFTHPLTSFSFGENPTSFPKFLHHFFSSTFPTYKWCFWEWNAENKVFNNVNVDVPVLLFDF